MEASQSQASANAALNPHPNPNINYTNNSNSILSSTPVWPTIDGPLGLSEEESLSYARRFYKFGYALLPFLWAVNCFYFWPVLRHSRSFPRLRPCNYTFFSYYLIFPLFVYLIENVSISFPNSCCCFDVFVFSELINIFNLSFYIVDQSMKS